MTARLAAALIALAAALPAGAAEEAATPLFEGRTLAGWAAADFSGAGAVKALGDGSVELGLGDMLTGLVYTNPVRRMDYELTLEARKVEGSDFFCGLTFPYGTNSCTLILGGWGGGVTGLSSIDGNDASENETSQWIDYEKDRWYRVRLTVSAHRIEAWLDDRRVVNLDTTDRRIGMRFGDIERCAPLGLATWQTRAQVRKLQVRPLPPAPAGE